MDDGVGIIQPIQVQSCHQIFTQKLLLLNRSKEMIKSFPSIDFAAVLAGLCHETRKVSKVSN